MPINSGSCQTPRKYANTGEQQPRLGTRDGFLEIFREASAAVEPCKRSFNDPTSWLDLERTGIFGSGDDLNGPAAELGECGGQLFPAVGAISENVTQLRKQQSNVLEQRHCSVCIGNDVPFAPLDLLTCIKPAWTAVFCGLHGLTIDDSSRWRALASRS